MNKYQIIQLIDSLAPKRKKWGEIITIMTCEQCGFIKDEEMVGEQMTYECPCCGFDEIEMSRN
jgi:predicted Zn-ribbon and HTH transcriptional regulator